MTQPAGLLDQRIVIERKTSTRNTIGEEVDTWSTHATVWAQYRPARVTERVAGAQLAAEFDAVFRIRWQSGIDAEMRVQWRGQAFELAGPPVRVDARGNMLDLYVRQGVRDGR